MTQERYELTLTHLYLIDQELDLNLTSTFDLPRLPHDLKSKGEHIVEKDEEGKIEKAYFLKEGKQHGEGAVFYSNGQKQHGAFYQNGLLHGPSLFYSQEAEVLARSWFYVGQKQGKSHLFYSSGKLYSCQRFKDGRLSGKQETFYENVAVFSNRCCSRAFRWRYSGVRKRLRANVHLHRNPFHFNARIVSRKSHSRCRCSKVIGSRRILSWTRSFLFHRN